MHAAYTRDDPVAHRGVRRPRADRRRASRAARRQGLSARPARAIEIALETRIITTADIFDALTADRPYRAAMPVTKALAIMTDMVGTAIDADCFAALRRALGSADETLAA